MDDYLIETRELTQQFGAKLAVDHLDPLVPAAGVYGFLGSNSAGKTTAGVGFSPQPNDHVARRSVPICGTVG
ncbi:MAG TPA: hypothetical protein VFD63_10810 [Pyrinomonadaceae bacterium]|nr:hypothetical protein [Pyrinomonadaceae bacterium]